MKIIDIFFQVSALLYTILVTIVFITQKKVNKLENFVYRGLLIVTFIEIFLDLGYHFACYYIPGTFITSALTKLFMCSTVTWSLTFTLYIFALSSPKNDGQAMTEEKKIYFTKKLFVLIAAILVIDIIIFILPIDIKIFDTYVLIEGPILSFVYVLITLAIIINVILVLRSKEGIFNKKYTPVHVLNVLTIAALVVQIFIPEISVNVMIASLCTMYVYFAIENPNLSLIEELNIATRQAEAANHAKSDFLSSMSHEIRTPLNAIIGFSQALAKEDISGSAKDEVKDILTASNNLLEIVNGILDISKIEANKIEIVNVDYSSRELLNDISTLINTRIGSKPIEFKIDVDDNLPPVLYGDSMRIKQILTNLLTNAVKYTKEGHVLFQVNFQTIGDKCKLMIKVEDTGIGMTEDDLKLLYTKFQRFDLDKNINIAGTGLGMAITKGLIDLLGGEILVKSTYGEGTTFTVFLDQQISSKKPEEIKSKETDGKVIPFDASGQRVLVVDDNKINLKVAEKLLADYKLEVELIDSGRECINKILSGEKYDIIFLDIMMPKMKGPEVLQNLKNIHGFNSPVVALTADIISGMEEKYISQGFDDCLPKPIVEEDLYYMLKRFLKGKDEPVAVVNDVGAVMVAPEKVTYVTDQKVLEENEVNLEGSLQVLENMDAYTKAADAFYKILDEKLAQLYEYKNSDDIDSYYILCKALKEEANEIGFTKFAEIAAEHENACKDKNMDFINANYTKLKMESLRVSDVLKKYLGK